MVAYDLFPAKGMTQFSIFFSHNPATKIPLVWRAFLYIEHMFNRITLSHRSSAIDRLRELCK
jgi:hypothetical protein